MNNINSWFGGPPSKKTYSTTGSHRSSSPRRTRSPRRAESPRRVFVRPHSPAASTTSRGYFTRPHQASTSSYKRSPREGYIAQLVRVIKRLLRDLIKYARENPMKMFTLVIMPLITGGVLQGLLRGVGIKLPAGLAGLAGGAKGAEGLAGVAGGIGGVEGALKIAKMFM